MKLKKLALISLVAITGLSTLGCTKQNQNNVSSNRVVQKSSRNKVTKSYKNITNQVWRIKNGRETIYGHIYKPANRTGKLKVAILSHGLGESYQQMEPYARSLAHKGYFTYAYDFPGGSMGGQSTGRDMSQMSIFTEERDLLAVINAVRKRNDTSKKKYLLVGASQGGAVSALTASRHPQHIKALALMFPAFSITANAQNQYRSFANVPEHPDLFGLPVGRAYYRHLFNMDLTRDATKFNGPVLIVHGEQDNIVPINYARQAANNFKHAQFRVLPNADHGFTSDSDRNQAIRYMDQFVNQLN